MNQPKRTSEATERPILFSGPMIRSLLAGTKTMTRRALKPQPVRGSVVNRSGGGFREGWHWNPSKDSHHIWHDDEDQNRGDWAKWFLGMCPYGTAGDRLYVRETWRETEDIDGRPVMEYRAGGTRLIDGKSIKHGEHRATSILPKWRPSIFMPRWASRITLQIESVRVERLAAISGDDCLAEGIEPQGIGSDMAMQAAFAELWKSINGKDSWDANPFVWVVSFRRTTP